MNKFEEAKKKQIDNLDDLIPSFEALISQNSFTHSMFSSITEYRQTINTLLTKADISIKVFWEKKKIADTLVIDLAEEYAKSLISFGRFKNFIVFAELENFSKTALERSRDQEMYTHVSMLIEIINTNPEKAAEAGVDSEKVVKLTEALANAKKLTEKPVHARSEIRLINNEIDQILDNFSKLLNGSLIDHMESNYAKTEPVFYNAFLVAINVVKPSYHQVAVRGKFTDENGEPVCYVRITIDGEEDIIKRSKKGGYMIKYLEPGTHTLVFKRSGYITQTVEVVILPQRTLELDIQFEPVAAEHAADVD